MPIVSLAEIMTPAFNAHYGVVAFNAVDDITLHALIKAAESECSPLIVQYSVKTLKFWGAHTVKALFDEIAGRATVPVALHLDHCPDPEFAKLCLSLGWSSVLFDGSTHSYEDNFRITREINEMAQGLGAQVEGEIVAVAGVEDDVGGEDEGASVDESKVIEFIRGTGIYCYAPAVGTAHGFYRSTPVIRYEHLERIVGATRVPMVLHGGSGLDDDVFRRLIKLGMAKINISTELKKTYCDGFHRYLEKSPDEYNPQKLIAAVHGGIAELARRYFHLFGSVGKA